MRAWNFQDRHRQFLQIRFPNTRIEACFNSKDFLELLPEADCVLVWHFKNEWLENAPLLKCIATPSAGQEWIEVEPTESLRVSFGGFHGPIMAESVIGAMLYFIKAFPQSLEFQKQKKWARVKLTDRMASLQGSHAVVWGFGKIGQAIGERLMALGCRVTGIKRDASQPERFKHSAQAVVDAKGLTGALESADHLILALPGTDETTHLLNRDVLMKLPSSCYLYNVGRGNACNEADLLDALNDERLAGAYLDVFETEPLPETSPLWENEKVLIQPHISAAVPKYLDWFLEEFADRVESDANGS